MTGIVVGDLVRDFVARASLDAFEFAAIRQQRLKLRTNVARAPGFLRDHLGDLAVPVTPSSEPGKSICCVAVAQSIFQALQRDLKGRSTRSAAGFLNRTFQFGQADEWEFARHDRLIHFWRNAESLVLGEFGDEDLPRWPARLFREHLLQTAPGGIRLHAATVAIDSKGWLVLGPKGAGKTTLTLSLLRAARATFIANDRTQVLADSQSCTATGVPVTIRIGKDYLESQGEFGRTLATAGVEYQNLHAADGKVELTPGELCKAIDCRRAAQCRIVGVLVPRIDLQRSALVTTAIPAPARDSLLAEALLTPDPAFPAYFFSPGANGLEAVRNALVRLPWSFIEGDLSSFNAVSRLDLERLS